jgi:hypothetical protein
MGGVIELLRSNLPGRGFENYFEKGSTEWSDETAAPILSLVTASAPKGSSPIRLRFFCFGLASKTANPIFSLIKAFLRVDFKCQVAKQRFNFPKRGLAMLDDQHPVDHSCIGIAIGLQPVIGG